jgi:hypothetical protein
MIEMSNTHFFSTGDGIEAIAYDPVHRRVALTSHYGCINVCALDKNSVYQGYSLLNLSKCLTRRHNTFMECRNAFGNPKSSTFC